MPSPPVPPAVPATYPAPSITLANRSISKSLSINPTIPNSATPVGEYGEVVTFDFSAPEDSVSVNIQWLPDSLIQGYVDMLFTPGSVLFVTDDAGVVWTGQVTSFSQKRLKGTNLSEVDITIRRTP